MQAETTRDIGVVALEWRGDSLALLDQRLLPGEERWLTLSTADEVFSAIRDMVVRGAPAIGISAAYGVVLAARSALESEDWLARIESAIENLAESRPTAVNLFWALRRMREPLAVVASALEAVEQLERQAVRIHQEDLAANLHMGALALEVIGRDAPEPISVLTHCNTGALATGGYGTALGVIRSLWKSGKLSRVYADETRPWLQGARLTAWELQRDGIPVTLNADSAAAHLMAGGSIKWVIVGADRITANGDVANKIGTYGLAVLARFHGVRFMVVAPSSTVDMQLASGRDIPIEQRTGEEVRAIRGIAIAPEDVEVFNPVFDVTPADLIDVIVTEKGVIEQPTQEKMVALFGGK
ncbi:S-methyl-5-thioribose-1-phosphate isomerase [Mangrovitalea sediminis]|uniref:S-methyl-5-thioribose-1-phosphate isomerase n=1 Tax=Mangrovitalea sediminis TaxID=1982043 RepID=UPI000BE61A58|nr:S-methyl-5-thioribose-1-phosphate isomerase [Mangrovitalea sediminis]